MALRSGPTVADLCDEYSARDNGKKAGTIRSDNSRIKQHIRPKLGHLKVASITSAQIEDFTRSLSVGNQARSVGLLGAMFSFAVKRGLRPNNPCKGVEKPKDNKKMRRLSETEYAQLGAAINGSVTSNIFLFLAVTGFRSGEANTLRWAELDIERKTAQLSDTKTGSSIRPLSGAAIDIINRQERSGEYVFTQNGQPIGNLRPHWVKLGLDKTISPHTLRHSFASLSADLGFSDNVIAGMLGHARSSVTSRYVHLEAALIKAADQVADVTLKLMKA